MTADTLTIASAFVFDDPRRFLDGPRRMIRGGSLREVAVINFLEFLDGGERIDFFNQLYLALAPGGRVQITVPYYSNAESIAHPRVQWPPISEHSFLYLSRKFRDEKPSHAVWGLTCDLELVSYEYDVITDFLTRNDKERHFGLSHYLNIATKLFVVLSKPDTS